MYRSQFRKIGPYDWFCGPGSHIDLELHAANHTARVVGRTMVGLVAAKRHLRLNLTGVCEKEKIFLLDAPYRSRDCSARQLAQNSAGWYSGSNQIKSNHFYCHITTAQVPW